MTRFASLALAAALTLPPFVAAAGAPLDGPGFDAATQGRTFVFSFDGDAYGAEQYLPGNRVLWSFLDGRCLHGEWRPDAGQICFAYEDRPGDFQCWIFREDGAGLSAQVVEDGPDGPLYSAREADAPLYCMGPDVGV